MTREEVVRIIKECKEKGFKHTFYTLNEYHTALDIAIKALEQQPKTGHWIEHPEIETSTPEYLMFYECSECGDRQCFCKSDIHKKRFCGNCGCRMVEPQERSDKE